MSHRASEQVPALCQPITPTSRLSLPPRYATNATSRSITPSRRPRPPQNRRHSPFHASREPSSLAWSFRKSYNGGPNVGRRDRQLPMRDARVGMPGASPLAFSLPVGVYPSPPWVSWARPGTILRSGWGVKTYYLASATRSARIRSCLAWVLLANECRSRDRRGARTPRRRWAVREAPVGAGPGRTRGAGAWQTTDNVGNY